MGFQAFILFAWVLGFFPGYESLWSLPAGWGAGTICFELWKFWKMRNVEVRVEKIFDSRSDDVPPEVKEKMKEITEILKSQGKIPKNAKDWDEREKCNDPHCGGCHPETADYDDNRHKI